MSSFSSVNKFEETPAMTSQPDNSSLGSTSEQTVSELKGDEHCSEPAPIFGDFPIDSSNPFVTPFCASDLVLVVEGKKLHVHKQILTVYCSYFQVMLNSHFAEADAKEIELKGSKVVEMKYEAMVKFLLRLYPVHSFKGITDDSSLMDLFPLAEYFQCQHVRTMCEAYIRQQLERIGPLSSMDSTKVSATSALLYLRLCENYDAEQFTQTLLQLLSPKSLKDIVNNEHFKCLTPEKQRDVLHRRAEFVERRLDKQVEEVKRYMDCSALGASITCHKCYKDTNYGCALCGNCSSRLNTALKDSRSA